MKFESGMLVRSKAGRDKGSIYVIIYTDEKAVFVSDGEKYSIRHMKRKNRIHLQPMLKIRMNCTPEDKAIRAFIKTFTRESGTGCESRDEKTPAQED